MRCRKGCGRRRTGLSKIEKLRKINKAKQILTLVGMLSLCFDAYNIVSIGSFPVTLSVLTILAFIIVGIIGMDCGEYPDKKRIAVFAAFMLLLSVSCVFNFSLFNANSVSLYVFFLLAYLFSAYRISDEHFWKQQKITAIVYTALSLYAIYQFVAYIYDLPLSDFIIPGHMTEGFNRSNFVQIGEFKFMRAHSIYLEPSTLSQFAAYTIIISFILYRHKLLKLVFLIPFVIVNSVAMILTIAGTGIMVLGVAMILFVVMCIVKRKYIAVPICAAVAIIAAILFVFLADNEIALYIRTRISEILDPKWSGGMRFTVPYIIAHWSVTHYFIGVSPGNEAFAIQQYRLLHPDSGMISTYSVFPSGYAKIAVEFGITGLVLLLILFSLLRKNSFYKYIFVFMLMIPFIGGNLLQPYLWIFIALLNCTPREGFICERNYRDLHHSGSAVYAV